MPKKPKPAAEKSTVDPASPEIVLRYVGGQTPRGVPARDLDGNTIGRIAYRRALAAQRASRSLLVAPDETRERVARPGPDDLPLDEVMAELTASEAFEPAEREVA